MMQEKIRKRNIFYIILYYQNIFKKSECACVSMCYRILHIFHNY